MSIDSLIKRGKAIAKEITSQHMRTVKIRQQLIIKDNIKNYDTYRSIIAQLKRAESHEKTLENHWWIIQDKIKEARKTSF